VKIGDGPSDGIVWDFISSGATAPVVLGLVSRHPVDAAAEPAVERSGTSQTVSMVSHRDLMYLVAVKSFHHQLRGEVRVILNDGSLTTRDSRR
jgi:hypothetical protein